MSLLPIIGSGESGDFYNGVATQSLRFDDGGSAYLSRTPASASTNLKAFTFSTWVKRSSVSGASHTLFSAGANSNDVTMIRFEGNGITDTQLSFFDYTSGSLTTTLKTQAEFRDSSAWYNIIVACDTTQSGANKAKIYINGVLVTDWHDSSHDEYPNDDSTFQFGNNVAHRIGSLSYSTTQLFDGYMAETNFIAESQVAYTEFGELKNGVWIPKRYAGSYGGNGFRLQYADDVVTAPESEGTVEDDNIGRDSSGEHNHWTASSGIVASDCAIPDCPENNFATMNPLSPFQVYNSNNVAYANGNLNLVHSGQSYAFTASNFAVKKGKWYAEMRFNTNSSGEVLMVGIAEANMETYYTGENNDPHTTAGTIWYVSDGAGYYDGSSVAHGAFSGSVAWGAHNVTSPGFVIGIAIDLDSGTRTVTFTKDGGSSFSKNLTSNFTDHIVFANNAYSGTGGGNKNWTWNFGQDSTFGGLETATSNADGNGHGKFHSAVPSGYLALCSANLDDSIFATIGPSQSEQAINHFGILTYTGNGSGPRTIVSGDTGNGIGGEIDFKPDWLWVKSRNTGYYHGTWDSSRTNKSALYPNENDDEDTSTAGTIGSLNTNGFTTPNVGSGGFINIGSSTYVAWNWKANGGSTSSHSSGDNSANHASVSQANQTAGFSIVTYTGDTSGNPTKMNHGLGKTPRMIIVKSRSAAGSWAIYHENMNPSTSYNHAMFLDTDADKTSAANSQWGGNAMVLNDNLFSVNNSTETNTNSTTYVAYCFAEVEGFSKFSSYTGNGSDDGAFVYTGFRPAFLMTKLVGAGENWHIFDSTRSTSNVTISRLIADDVTAENNNDSILDFLSNGFKFREDNAGWNGSGTYIYMAFAEAPFKYANAR